MTDKREYRPPLRGDLPYLVSEERGIEAERAAHRMRVQTVASRYLKITRHHFGLSPEAPASSKEEGDTP